MSNAQRAIVIVSCLLWALTQAICLPLAAALDGFSPGWFLFGLAAIGACFLVANQRGAKADVWLFVLAFWFWPAGLIYAFVMRPETSR